MTNGLNGQQLWNIADSLWSKMNADEFRDYGYGCLGFIFYKYLCERQHLYANEVLAEDGIEFLEIDESSEEGQEYLEAIRKESITTLGYFLKPSELFSALVERALGAKKAHTDVKDQEKIADCLTAIARKSEALSRQIGQSEKFQKGLLQKYLFECSSVEI